MMKKLIFLCLTALCLTACVYPALAAEAQGEAEALLNEQLDMLDFEGVQRALNKGGDESLSFREIVTKAVRGELDLSPGGLADAFLSALFSEARENGALMRNMLVVCVLSALLKNLTESFRNKAVGELGFYVCYVVLVILLFTAFQTAVELTRELVTALTELMQASVPLLISLLVMSGTVGAPVMFSPMLIFAVNAVSLLVGGFILPFAVLGAAVDIVNYITEKEILTHFAALIKNICGWSLRGVAVGFVALLTLQKLSAPILNNVAVRSAKAAAGAVPVVGEMLAGAWDMVLVWASAIKSGVLVALVVAVAAACALPAIKLLALIFIFKASAALVQPVCDERIVKCLNSVAGFSVLLLGCVATAAAMFVMSAVVLLSF